MSVPTPQNPHTVRRGAYELVFWLDGAASGQYGADRACVQQLIEGVGRVTVGEYRMPQQEADLDKVLDALQRAYEVGRKDMAADFRKMLGVQAT